MRLAATHGWKESDLNSVLRKGNGFRGQSAGEQNRHRARSMNATALKGFRLGLARYVHARPISRLIKPSVPYEHIDITSARSGKGTGVMANALSGFPSG